MATLAMIVAAFLVPDTWFEQIDSAYGKAETFDPFSPEIATMDQALLMGTSGPTMASVESHLPKVQARRLLYANKLPSDGIPELVVLLEQHQARIQAQQSAASKQAERAHRNKTLVQRFPRLKPHAVEATLDKLDRDILALIPTGKTNADCATCHAALMDLPTGTRIEPKAIWPKVDATRAGGGTAIPVMMDSLDLAAYQIDLGADDSDPKDCLNCHVNHGEPGFAVDVEARREAMGLWIEVYRIQNSVYVQTKVKNIGAAHRAPGGYIGRGYAIVVEAYEGHDATGKPLPFFYGEQLPEYLQSTGRVAGSMYWRRFTDASGAASSDHRNLATVHDDSRLLGERFLDQRYVFTLPEPDGKTPYYVLVRLVYLPDVMTWDGAQDVEVRVFKTG